MQKITLTMDSVSDVVRTSYKGTYTRFGFSSGAQSHNGLMIKGHPRIESGMTITAILRKDDDWSTLEGWFDHDTGICAMPRIPSPVVGVLMAMFSVMLVYFYLQGQDSSLHVDAPAALFGLVIGCLAFLSAWQYLIKKKIYNVLTQLQSTHRQENLTLYQSAALNTRNNIDPWNIDAIDGFVALFCGVGAFVLQRVLAPLSLSIFDASRNALLLAVIAIGVRKIAQAIQGHRERK